ncbi:MAG: RCC1 domain-containing protein [Geobacteraceae bacterium]
MHRITRQILRPFLFGVLPLFLAACGSDDTLNNSSAVYGNHSVVLVSATTKAFGANGYGQLGNGATTDSSIPVTVSGTYSAVSIGGAHNVGLKSDLTVWTWGLNSSGQLGNGTLDSKTSPIQVTALNGVKAVAAGGNHTLAIAADDTVWAWGLNSSGQLGDNTLVTRNIPVQVLTSDGVTPLSGITAIAAGGAFSLALKSDGTVWAWGSNSNGQLGNASLVASSVPVQVVISGGTALSGITAIAAGGSHALAINGSDTMHAWGYNELGQLGDGTTTSSSIAVPVIMPGVVTAISAGLDHSLAIIGGAVHAWGYNYYGQLGNGAALQSDAPVTSPQVVQNQDGVLLASIVDIIAVGHHSIARDVSSTIWVWGNNTYGQLGDGTTQGRSRAKVLVN